MSVSPKVSVIMPVYNSEKYLKEAIDSVLNQTFKDFEFIIINDGSTDNSLNIIKKYNDSRIQLINNEQNIKLIATLNKGLKLAKGDYIIRMDSDDVSFPERFHEQVKFMDENPEIGICGSFWERSIDKEAYKPPLDHEDIKIHLLKGSAILHPTSIFRKKYFDEYNLTFDSSYLHAEDYELWVRAVRLFKLANIPKKLLMYRTHPKQITKSYSKEQEDISIEILDLQLKHLGIQCDREKVQTLYYFFNKSKFNQKQIEFLIKYFDIILAANEKVTFFDQIKLKIFLKYNLTRLWDRCLKYNISTFYLYNKSLFFGKSDISILLYLKMVKRLFISFVK